ncbi:glycosyltransferase family 2 protein [Paenibacillus alvei]|uniref:glycosyltransferase family 2 protein n=1 Tax=Paenibacillus alvei TaxID=44250 RepID=UPI00227EC99E|nr:glycosyltransferase family 2 protein [Paenibacillus alvei]MCY7485300.1 glycosyltransferase family 2 protein [Paenibacillus alvei]
MNKQISVVVPMYFEEQVVHECYKRLSKVLNETKYDYEIIFVNDGSEDNTLELLSALAKDDQRVRVLDFSRNFGHQIAVTAGINHSSGDAVVVIDADLQDPPELINEMIKKWEEGYDVIYAKRRKRDGESKFKLITAKMFYRVLDNLTSIRIPVDTGDFRLMDRKVVEVLNAMDEKNRFIRGMVSWLGFKQIPIEFDRKERFAGETKYPLKKMIKFALDGIISFSTKPLKYAAYLGFFSVLISILIIAYTLVMKIAGSESVVSGWASIMILVSFLGGVQLLSISILGEYIGRIYEESKNRPLYIVKEKINFNNKND